MNSRTIAQVQPSEATSANRVSQSLMGIVPRLRLMVPLDTGYSLLRLSPKEAPPKLTNCTHCNRR